MHRIVCYNAFEDITEVAAAVETTKLPTWAWSPHVVGVCGKTLVAKVESYLYKQKERAEIRDLVVAVDLPNTHELEDLRADYKKSIVKLKRENSWVVAVDRVNNAMSGVKESLDYDATIAQHLSGISDACEALVAGAKEENIRTLTKLVMEAGLHDNDEPLDLLTSDFQRAARMLMDGLREWSARMVDLHSIVPPGMWLDNLDNENSKQDAKIALDQMRSLTGGLIATIEAAYIELNDTVFFPRAQHAGEFWQTSSWNWHTRLF